MRAVHHPQPISANSDLQHAIHLLEHAKQASIEELTEIQHALTSFRDLLLWSASEPGILPTFEVGITQATSMWLAELDTPKRRLTRALRGGSVRCVTLANRREV